MKFYRTRQAMTFLSIGYDQYREDRYHFEGERWLRDQAQSDIVLVSPRDMKFVTGNRERCMFCRGRMEEVYLGFQDWPWTTHHSIYACPACQWWDNKVIVEVRDFTFAGVEGISADRIRRAAIARRFSEDGSEAPIEVLYRELVGSNVDARTLNPVRLEQVAAHVFKSFFNCEVQHVGRSHDGGIDLILICGDEQTLVQVKRRVRDDSVEQVSPVREFLGSLVLSGADRGIFLTTASRFTKGAVEVAEAAKAKNIVKLFELIDYRRFCEILGVVRKSIKTPWLEYVERHRPEYLSSEFLRYRLK